MKMLLVFRWLPISIPPQLVPVQEEAALNCALCLARVSFLVFFVTDVQKVTFLVVPHFHHKLTQCVLPTSVFLSWLQWQCVLFVLPRVQNMQPRKPTEDQHRQTFLGEFDCCSEF